jgi:large subunit ribosomal protein L2
MALIFSKPTTPSQRHLIRLNRELLAKTPLIKQKILGLKTGSGRNHSGKITLRRKGSGHKKKYRRINFSRTTKSIGIVVSIEYDPNRNTSIASVFDFTKNSFFYILAPKKLNIGNIVESGFDAELHTGNSLPLFKIPEGSFIHNITLSFKKKAQLTRAAGTSAILKEKTINYARIQISSKKEKLIPIECYATLGILSNESYFLTQLGKAGQSRWLNKRPKVRGVAMNPVDHPHGGGEGKKSGKGFSPWGKPNKKTINKKK